MKEFFVDIIFILAIAASSTNGFSYIAMPPHSSKKFDGKCQDFSGKWEGICKGDAYEYPFSLNMIQGDCEEIMIESRMFPFGGVYTEASANDKEYWSRSVYTSWEKNKSVFVQSFQTQLKSHNSSDIKMYGPKELKFTLNSINEKLIILAKYFGSNDQYVCSLENMRPSSDDLTH